MENETENTEAAYRLNRGGKPPHNSPVNHENTERIRRMLRSGNNKRLFQRPISPHNNQNRGNPAGWADGIDVTEYYSGTIFPCMLNGAKTRDEAIRRALGKIYNTRIIEETPKLKKNGRSVRRRKNPINSILKLKIHSHEQRNFRNRPESLSNSMKPENIPLVTIFRFVVIG